MISVVSSMDLASAILGPKETAWVGVGKWEVRTGVDVTQIPVLVGNATVSSTDFSEALQFVIDSVSKSGGGVVKLEKDNYFVSRLLPRSGVVIDLGGSTLKLKDNSLSPLIFDGGAAGGGGSNFGVINGILDCNQANNNGLNVLGGIWLTGWNGLTFKNLTIKNCFRIGINLVGVSDLSISKYKFIDSGDPLGGGPVPYAYALSISANGETRSKHISLDGIVVKNVYGYGIHIYKCDDFDVRNLNFDTLNYGSSSIALTITEASRGALKNLVCKDVSGDNIEVNDSSSVLLENIDVINAGNRALLVGYNTSGNYNRRLKVSRFVSRGTKGDSAVVLSACIDSDFSRFDIDKCIYLDSSLSLSVNNSLTDSTVNDVAASSPGLFGYGLFSLRNVAFSDYCYKHFGQQSADVVVKASIPAGDSFYIKPSEMLPALFGLEGAVSGSINATSVFSSSPNQFTSSSLDFLINNYGTSAPISAVKTLNSDTPRPLTFAGDAANKQVVATNANGVALTVSIQTTFRFTR